MSPGLDAGGLVMAKPMGPRCNLRCGYCYYLPKAGLFSDGGHPMALDLLERFIHQRFASTPGPHTHFEWHGGEPTLAGRGFFQAVVRLQRQWAPRGRTWSNGLQTNGVILDQGWVDFLVKEQFTVGLSLDGTGLHHGLRPRVGGQTSHAATMKALELLQGAGVVVNLLGVVHLRNVEDPDGVYDFYRSTGVPYWQFLPLVDPPGRAGYGASPRALGAFLCRIYDRWMAQDVGRVVIQNIDEAFRSHVGQPHSLCIHRETCGDVVVLEHDGSLYSCDHFVDPDHGLGNLRDLTLGQVWSDPRQLAFGQAKRQGLSPVCRECPVLESCHGGCPKDRDEGGLNRLCEAYRTFFDHVGPGLSALAHHWNQGRSLRSFSGPELPGPSLPSTKRNSTA